MNNERNPYYLALERQLDALCKKLGIHLPTSFKRNRILTELGQTTEAFSAMPYMTADMDEYIKQNFNWEQLCKELEWKYVDLPPVWKSEDKNEPVYKNVLDKMNAITEKQGASVSPIFEQFDMCRLLYDDGSTYRPVRYVPPEDRNKFEQAIERGMREDLELLGKDEHYHQLHQDHWKIKIYWGEPRKFTLRTRQNIKVEFYFEDVYWKSILDKSSLHSDCEYDVYANISDGNWGDGIRFSLDDKDYRLKLQRNS